MVINIIFKGKVLSRGKMVEVSLFHWGIRFKVNGVVLRLMEGKAIGGLFTKDRTICLKLRWDKCSQGRFSMICGKGSRVCCLSMKFD